MNTLLHIMVFLAAFSATELLSWFIHKYIMHGPLWNIHRTHHIHTKGFFELNDIFSAFFGSVSVVLIVLGAELFDARFWAGLGIATYGMLYFVLHDVLIHRRLSFGKRPEKGYLRSIADAHRDHHKSNKKDDAVSFGLLLVSKKYFKES